MITSKTNRRQFVKSAAMIATTTLTPLIPLPSYPEKKVNKREAVQSLIEGKGNSGYTPAGFFVHFGEDYRWGDAAVKRHLEYFEAIDMDFIKVQYEQTFPALDHIKAPEDWSQMALYKRDFYEKQLFVVKELVKKGKSKAPVIVTLYSPFMCAGHSVTSSLVTEHLQQDPEQVKKGLEVITESVLIFAKECIKLGVDGFLASTQGGEAFRFDNPSIFAKYIKPYDLVVMDEINAATNCNILHVCDYEGDYNDLRPFVDYPGQIVNCSTKVGDKYMSTKEIYTMFDRPFMGGLEKRGPITGDNIDELDHVAEEAIKSAPDRYIIGAECALLGEVDWKKVRRVVDHAHGYVK